MSGHEEGDNRWLHSNQQASGLCYSAMAPIREGVDFFAGESNSVVALTILLNQRVGVEPADRGCAGHP